MKKEICWWIVYLAIALSVGSCCLFDLDGSRAARQKRQALEMVHNAWVTQTQQNIVGKKVKSLTNDRKEAILELEDGTTLVFTSVAHHGAGSHLTITGR